MDHIVNPANDRIDITVMDAAGAGGASHVYVVNWRGEPTADNPKGPVIGETILSFQNGSIKEKGVNGITQEALLAVVIDRLRSFQAGPFACEENAEALTYLEAAQKLLMDRTRARMARGVEGTLEK